MKATEEAFGDAILQKALAATSESRHIEFKRRFDPTSTGAWCEIIKDIVAIANSGGGVIVFGLDDFGHPTGDDIEPVLKIDPADSANRLFKYTGVNLEIEIRPTTKNGHSLASFLIPSVDMPLVFQKPGSYSDTPNSPKVHTAFYMGTMYFRHGAKSEAGNGEDIRKIINRKLAETKKSWLKNVRKVAMAPSDTEIVAIPKISKGNPINLATVVHSVNDPNALPVRLTRDAGKAVGKFVHEEVSEALLDEINNVIDVNRILAKGQRQFFLGQPIYFRIYAERQHAVINETDAELLLSAGISEFYAPSLFWMLKLPDTTIAKHFKEWYKNPRQPQCYGMIRFAALLGRDFTQWLWERCHKAWENHAQPPAFHWPLKEMPKKLQTHDPRVVASRHSISTSISVPSETSVTIGTLLKLPEQAAALLSKVCMSVFHGDNSGSIRDTARILDYVAYGDQISQRSKSLAQIISSNIGDELPAMPQETQPELTLPDT
jgi:hypothetical protein